MNRIVTVLLLVGVGLAGCTNNNESSPDDDGDGLTNADEAAGWNVVVETMTQRLEYWVTSDPHLIDTDGDGLADVYEAAFGLDPRKKDSDEDGLTDCQEILHTNQTECEDPSFEGETDGGYKTSPTLADSDASASRYVNARPEEFAHRARNEIGQIPRGDGIPDGEEVAGFQITLPDGRTRHVQTDPLQVDTDKDGLEDAQERFVYGTDPTVADTDGDGCEDGFDMVPAQAEQYRIRLKEFIWLEAGRSGATGIVFHLAIVDRGQMMPSPGAFTVQHGVHTNISSLSPPAVGVLDCSYPADEPWFRIDLQVAEIQNGQYVGPIDVHSDTVPNGNVSVWMHARTGEYRWDFEKPGGPPAGELVWKGREGEVRFEPVVVIS